MVGYGCGPPGGVLLCRGCYGQIRQIVVIDKGVVQTVSVVPGYGAQGGKAADIAQYMNNSNGGVVNSSRGILLAYKKQPGVAFDEAAYNECVRMKEDIQGECNKL